MEFCLPRELSALAGVAQVGTKAGAQPGRRAPASWIHTWGCSRGDCPEADTRHMAALARDTRKGPSAPESEFWGLGREAFLEEEVCGSRAGTGAAGRALVFLSPPLLEPWGQGAVGGQGRREERTSPCLSVVASPQAAVGEASHLLALTSPAPAPHPQDSELLTFSLSEHRSWWHEHWPGCLHEEVLAAGLGAPHGQALVSGAICALEPSSVEALHSGLQILIAVSVG